jgi:SAM-dependent methyltransferase
MTDLSLQEQIAAAAAYEEYFVPALFQEWAPRVADAAMLRPGQRVLDVACGTGVLAREALLRVGEQGLVAGLDLNPGMLSVAEQQEPLIKWRQGKAEALPYGDGSFDAVVSQFGLPFFDDRLKAVNEMLRVLVPGGRLAIAVWAALDVNSPYAAELSVLERVAGHEAAEALQAAFVLGQTHDLAVIFNHAGVASLRISTYNGRAVFPSLRAMIEADVRGFLPVFGVLLPEQTIQEVLAEAERSMNTYVAPGGRVAFDRPAIIVTGSLPGDAPSTGGINP